MEELDIAKGIGDLKARVNDLIKQSPDASQATVSIAFLNEITDSLEDLRNRLTVCAMGNHIRPECREDF